jgi:aspartyl-tRNA(Asn)/glutamyl-tRNA(Gln) amidotransferase subunit A
MPDGPWDEVATVIVAAEAAAAHHALIESGKAAELQDPTDRVGGYVIQQVSAADYVLAQRARSVLRKKIDAVYAKYDVLAAPSMTAPAPPLTADLLDPALFPPEGLGAVGNLCGLPAVSVPCGFAGGKLPVGLALAARAGDDATALAAARLFQAHTDWHTRRPPELR